MCVIDMTTPEAPNTSVRGARYVKNSPNLALTGYELSSSHQTGQVGDDHLSRCADLAIRQERNGKHDHNGDIGHSVAVASSHDLGRLTVTSHLRERTRSAEQECVAWDRSSVLASVSRSAVEPLTRAVDRRQNQGVDDVGQNRHPKPLHGNDIRRPSTTWCAGSLSAQQVPTALRQPSREGARREIQFRSHSRVVIGNEDTDGEGRTDEEDQKPVNGGIECSRHCLAGVASFSSYHFWTRHTIAYQQGMITSRSHAVLTTEIIRPGDSEASIDDTSEEALKQAE